MAKIIGVTDDTVINWEKGRNKPSNKKTKEKLFEFIKSSNQFD
jgi:DNA-binding transcriptional regulator YiaG